MKALLPTGKITPARRWAGKTFEGFAHGEPLGVVGSRVQGSRFRGCELRRMISIQVR